MSHFDSEGREQQERRTPSAFQWPSPSQTPLLYSDISIKDILDTYQHDVELLKVILLAKAEEDKVPSLCLCYSLKFVVSHSDRIILS